MDTKKLRQKILDLAIRGKLVPQDPNDEPASVLLERIKAEKEQLIKEGKIKRSKKSESADKPHYENVPFEIPESWVWTTISTFTYDLQYGTSEKSSDEGIVPVLRMGNITRIGSIDYSDLVYSSNMEDIQKYKLEKNDLLFNRTNSSDWVGKTAIFKSETPTIYAGYLIRIRCIIVSPDYVNFVMNSLYHRDWCNQVKTDAVNQSNINAQKLSNFQIPIPPYSEQLRIVNKAKQLLSIIDILDERSTDLKMFIDNTKSKILGLAISGKLVPQDASDGPAIELLKRINPSFKPCDNSHYENVGFDIPEKWCWATIGDIFEHNTGKALNASNPNGILLDYITTSNLYWDRFELSAAKQMPFTESEIERYVVTKGDLLVCEGGDIGRSAIWNYDYDIMIQNHIHRLRGKIDVCTRYFFYLFMYYKMRNLIGGKGVAIQGLSSRDLHNLIIPVPPLKEQHNIASSIDLYFSKLDTITAELQ